MKIRIDARLIFALILAAYLILKINPATFVNSDDNLYMYMARQVLQGYTPYRDFYFAHPPLLLYLTALSYSLFGVSAAIGKLTPALGGLIVLIATYLAGEKIRKNLGLAASILLFFSFSFQSITELAMGTSLNLAFIMLAFYFLMDDKPLPAGILTGLCFLARYNSFPIAIIFLAYTLLRKEKRFLLGLLLTAPIFLYLSAIPNFLNNTLLYHFSKHASFLSVGYREAF